MRPTQTKRISPYRVPSFVSEQSPHKVKGVWLKVEKWKGGQTLAHGRDPHQGGGTSRSPEPRSGSRAARRLREALRASGERDVPPPWGLSPFWYRSRLQSTFNHTQVKARSRRADARVAAPPRSEYSFAAVGSLRPSKASVPPASVRSVLARSPIPPASDHTLRQKCPIRLRRTAPRAKSPPSAAVGLQTGLKLTNPPPSDRSILQKTPIRRCRNSPPNRENRVIYAKSGQKAPAPPPAPRSMEQNYPESPPAKSSSPVPWWLKRHRQSRIKKCEKKKIAKQLIPTSINKETGESSGAVSAPSRHAVSQRGKRLQRSGAGRPRYDWFLSAVSLFQEDGMTGNFPRLRKVVSDFSRHGAAGSEAVRSPSESC